TNPMFARMFGYESEEGLLGRSVESLFSTHALQLSRADRAAVDATPTEVLPVELECTRKDGTGFVAACVLTPLRMGGANHWLAVFNDVTERKRLEREIIEIANREQQRIGSDLHDGLGQDLTGIALMLRGIGAQLRKEGSAACVDIEDVISLVNAAIESTRTLARGLSPVSAERDGLAAALQSLAARATERYAIPVTFEARVTQPLPSDEAAATHVYRIAQEALTNAMRHSRAKEVHIALTASDGELQLEVADDGVGFASAGLDPAASASSNGLGLKIMRYRAQMLGGNLAFVRGTRGGATVRCSCPLGQAAPFGGTEERHPS
ncbi:MAG: ATP-binding protein, partial [Steroidobacteraceae bacterium]